MLLQQLLIWYVTTIIGVGGLNNTLLDTTNQIKLADKYHQNVLYGEYQGTNYIKDTNNFSYNEEYKGFLI